MKLCVLFFPRSGHNADRDKAGVCNPWSEQQERFAWLGGFLARLSTFPASSTRAGDNWKHLTLHSVIASSIICAHVNSDTFWLVISWISMEKCEYTIRDGLAFELRRLLRLMTPMQLSCGTPQVEATYFNTAEILCGDTSSESIHSFLFL